MSARKSLKSNFLNSVSASDKKHLVLRNIDSEDAASEANPTSFEKV